MVYVAPLPEETTMANAVVHFEIPADDVARATAFYEKTFGWKIKKYPMPPGGQVLLGCDAQEGRARHRRRPDEAQHARPAVHQLHQRPVDRRHEPGGAGQRRDDRAAEAGDRPEHGLDLGLQGSREQHDRPPSGAADAAEEESGEKKKAAKKAKGAAKGRKAKKSQAGGDSRRRPGQGSIDGLTTFAPPNAGIASIV